MKQSSAPLAASSAVMLLCGFYNIIFNLLRRASHFIGTLREAAQLETDYTQVGAWKDIAVSVYDLLVLVRLSSGILAAVQLAAAVIGLVYAALFSFRKAPPKGFWLPCALGVFCILLGAVSVSSAILAKSVGALLGAVLCITSVIVPTAFTVAALRIRKNAKILSAQTKG